MVSIIHRITIFLVFISFLTLHFLYISFSDKSDIWKSCCKEGCDYKIGDTIKVDGVTYYCCESGWSREPCCVIRINHFYLVPRFFSQCGGSDTLRAVVNFTANSEVCRGEIITVFRPDGSKFCDLKVDDFIPGRDSIRDCLRIYDIPTQSGEYTFKAVYKDQVREFNLRVQCPCELKSISLNPSSTDKCGEEIDIEISIEYAATEACLNQKITVLDHFSNEILEIPITSIGNNLVGKRNIKYKVPNQAGEYTFKAVLQNLEVTTKLEAKCCKVDLKSLSLNPNSTDRCGDTIDIKAEVKYSASGDCKDQNITVLRPDGSELCKIPISIGENQAGSCSGIYNVPTQSGNYNFSAVYEENKTSANLTVICRYACCWSDGCYLCLESFSISPSSTTDCGKTININAMVRYSASGNCQNKNIIIVRPDGSELCRIPVSTGSNLVGSCSGSYNVPTRSGSYLFSAIFGTSKLERTLTVNCGEGLDCSTALGIFSSRCPSESINIPLRCSPGEVCIYRIENVFACDNTDKMSDVISSGYYCIDKRNPYFVDIQHRPELISSGDYTYDPFPNYYIDKDGRRIPLTPDKVVIDKESITFTSKSRDEYNGREISGVRFSSLRFDKSPESTKSTNFPVSSCPGGALYPIPATHTASFGRLDIGWGRLEAYIADQAGNSASNSNYQVYIFLGARGDQQNQRGTDKIIFLKTYWDSSSEVKSKTNSLGGNYHKKIDCFGYRNKCTQIRDIIGKTDEFTDCLWVGPANNPRNVKIYNFKDFVDLEANTKINPQYIKDYGNRIVIAWENIRSNDLRRLAVCSKNDTGILVDLPFLVSKNIRDGFQFLPSTEKRFSVIWEAEYAREQRELNMECYLNPTIDGKNACTINDILFGNCILESGQKCKCGNSFPCTQNTARETINSCSVENPRYFSGVNRIICKMYDPRDKGIRVEIWFNHEFYFMNGIVISKKSSIFEVIHNLVVQNLIKSLKLFKLI
ncbi:MAG: hypothetical protein QXW35_03390 [Candidatus Aenigmatarchaeota archaeon]